MAIEKIKILGAILELPAKQQCQSSPFTSEIGPNGLNWQCYLAGSSKTAPRILTLSPAYTSIWYYKTYPSQNVNKSIRGLVTPTSTDRDLQIKMGWRGNCKFNR